MQLDDDAPATLARCRLAGDICDLPLHALGSRLLAEAFQAAAFEALGGKRCGYKIGATSVGVQQLLGCQEPIFAPLRREDVLAADATFQIPAGLLGVECEFGYLMARDYPAPLEEPDLAGLRSAIADCFVALEIVGRRVVAPAPLDEISAVADFALDVAAVQGRSIPDWRSRDLASMAVLAVVDGVTEANGSGSLVLAHPENALLWLAKALQASGGGLRAGDIVLTGTCTGITKVSPGQVFEGRFDDLPPVRLKLL